MYYADAADDKTEFDTLGPSEDTVREVGIQLVRALRSCGFKGEKLREQLEKAEFFVCSPKILEELLKEKGLLRECSGVFSLGGIEVQATQVEKDVVLEPFFAPITKSLFDQPLDFVVETFDGTIG